MQLRTLIDAFVASYAGRDPSLITRLAFWREQLGDVAILEIDADMVEAAMANLVNRGALMFLRGKGNVSASKPLTGATLNRYLVALGSVLTFARKRRLLPRGHVSAIAGVEKMRESEGRLVYLTEEQVERVIACAALSRWRKLPALIRVAFTTGLRLGALQGLRWQDINLEAGRAGVARTKNGSPHVAHLTAATVSALRALPGHRLAHGLVFSGKDEHRPHQFKKAWEIACRGAGLEPIPFHALRHSCASHLASLGASSVLLADTLGHKSLRMVARYAHLSIEVRAKAIEGAFR